MTDSLTISTKKLKIAVAAILILIAIAAISAGRADAATPATVKATCYSDGYLTISDGGNVAPAPQFLRLQIGVRTSAGIRWTTYAWRPVTGGTFRMNATKGGKYYIYATVATRTASGGFTYARGYVSVTNVGVSPIGAITVISQTNGFCQT
jgi:hypothetical protein